MKILIVEDSDILELMNTDPRLAISRLYDKYIDYLSAEIFFLIKNEEYTQDIIQDLFLTLWKNQYHLRGIKSNLKGYLRQAGKNKALNFIKKEKYYISDEGNEEIFSDSDQHNELITEELEIEIGKVIDNLPEKCRQIFILSRFEQMTYKEISETMDLSVKTVENQIGKALKILRKKIYEDIGVN